MLTFWIVVARVTTLVLRAMSLSATPLTRGMCRKYGMEYVLSMSPTPPRHLAKMEHHVGNGWPGFHMWGSFVRGYDPLATTPTG
jgi:hypothetical protein